MFCLSTHVIHFISFRLGSKFVIHFYNKTCGEINEFYFNFNFLNYEFEKAKLLENKLKKYKKLISLLPKLLKRIFYNHKNWILPFKALVSRNICKEKLYLINCWNVNSVFFSACFYRVFFNFVTNNESTWQFNSCFNIFL